MDFGDLLRRSWNIVWQQKFMIVLGFLAALGSGGTSANANYSFNQEDFEAFNNFPFQPERIEELVLAAGAVIFLLICIGILLGLVLWLVRLTSQAALIHAASRLDAGEKMSFGQALSAGWQKLLSMVGLNILLYGVFVVLGVIALVIFAGSLGAVIAGATVGIEEGEMGALFGSLGFIGLCLVGLLCLMLPLALIVNLIYPFAQRALVLEHQGVVDSIGRAWRVIRDNLGDVIILILLFLLLNIAVAAVLFAVLIPFGALSFGPLLFSLFSGEALQPLNVALAIGGAILIAIVGAVVNALYIAFRSTAVTLAYETFTRPPKATMVEPGLPPKPAASA